MFIVTRVLILTQNVAYAMQTAGALEKPGAFKVTPFTSAENALSHLRAYPQDVMLVDVTLPGMNPAVFIQEVRETQPDIAIIAMPDVDVARRLVVETSLHGITDFSWTARKLVPLIKDAQKQVYESQPGTSRIKPISEEEVTNRITPVEQTSPMTVPEQAKSGAVEVVISEESGGAVLQVPPEMQQSGQLLQDADEALDIFQKLASEEPPMPSFEESGTIRDLKAAMLEGDSISRMAATFQDDATEPLATVDDEPTAEEPGAIPAALILASATDDSTPLDSFSLDEFLARINEQITESGRAVQPLPSWIAESEKYVREPDFLPDFEDMALGTSQPLEYTAPTTTSSEPQLSEQGVQSMETERSQPVPHSRPMTAEDFTLPVIEPVETVPEKTPTAEEIPAVTAPEPVQPAEETGTAPPVPPEVIAAQPPVRQFTHTAPGDEYVVRLALTLTQVSLELTSEATVLARGGEVVAYAGAMPMEDILEIRNSIAGDWQASATQGRIRFITLQSSGQDYMLYSRGVEGGFTLSMIFSGTQQLQRIRRQGKRLADALSAVPVVADDYAETEATAQGDTAAPDAAPVDETPHEAAEIGAPEPLTFVWLLRDPDFNLDDEAVRAVVKGLDVQLSRLGWQIKELDVHEDYVYLFADVPAVKPPAERIRDLMQRSGEIIRRSYPARDAATLWADSYLALTPGRELRQDEIQDFFYFAGM